MTFYVTAYKSASDESPAHVSPHSTFGVGWVLSSELLSTHSRVVVEGHGICINRSRTRSHPPHVGCAELTDVAPAVRAGGSACPADSC